MLALMFSFCIVFSLSLTDEPISDSNRGQLACHIDQSGSCTQCNENIDDDTVAPFPLYEQCPEWSMDDVTRIIQSQTKAGATLAAICLLYSVGSIRYGIAMQKHISDYLIEYV